MANIRFRRFSGASAEGWELDCIVLPSDEVNGELVHFSPNQVVAFREDTEPDLYETLDTLLDSLLEQDQIPREYTKLVVGRFKDELKVHYSFKSSDEYNPDSVEAEIWRVIDSVYSKKMKLLN